MTQFLEEAGVREQSQPLSSGEADRLASSKEHKSFLTEEHCCEEEEGLVASESRESKTMAERVRERGTLREKKAPILLERITPSECTLP